MKKALPISILVLVSSVFIVPYFNNNSLLSKKTNIEQNLEFLESNPEISEANANGSLLENKSENFFFDSSGNLVYFTPTRVDTPEFVRGLYMTSWIAGRKDLRKTVHHQIRDNENLNTIIIDIKDDTGKISFKIDHPLIVELESSEKRIPDIREFIEELHKDNIYVIGRIAVFQDPHLIKRWPDEAVKKMSDPTQNWVDRKNIGWMDASSEKVWDYVATIAEESYKVGFDEINFDYIRFPSDGNMKDIHYTLSQGKFRPDVLEDFFKYLHDRLKPQGIVISADIFGMTTVNTDDLGIGQVLEKTIPYFDFVCPMVYPSHFPNGWAGIENPASEPYLVIKKSMGKAVERVIAMGEDPKKLRPWLQDFDLGADYTEDLVRAQLTATYDVGLDSWLMWDPRNTYTINAYK